MLRSEIENIVNGVLNNYVSKGGAYKQFTRILSGENIQYKEVDANADKFCGVFTRSLEGKRYIIVNKNIDNIGRKNFTIAHELGHCFLGHELKITLSIDKEINEECSNKNTIEYEADYFATCLLMPKDKAERAFKSILSNNYKGVPDYPFVVNQSNYKCWAIINKNLTNRFGVSETALRYRLSSLDLVAFENKY